MELDDFGVESTILKRFPRDDVHGFHLIGVRSYLRLQRERGEAGLPCPDWEELDTVFEDGCWCVGI